MRGDGDQGHEAAHGVGLPAYFLAGLIAGEFAALVGDYRAGFMSVTDIKTVEPSADLVERCKSLLKDAESGELQGIVGVVIYETGDTAEFWVAPPKGYHINLISDRIVGCIERIKYQLLSHRYNVDAEDGWMK